MIHGTSCLSSQTRNKATNPQKEKTRLVYNGVLKLKIAEAFFTNGLLGLIFLPVTLGNSDVCIHSNPCQQ